MAERDRDATPHARYLAQADDGGIPDLEWLDRAACQDADPQVFFLVEGLRDSSEAMRYCRACPVRRECVTWAYREEIFHGTFGGVSSRARLRMSLREALETIDADERANPLEQAREELDAYLGKGTEDADTASDESADGDGSAGADTASSGDSGSDGADTSAGDTTTNGSERSARRRRRPRRE